jgi:hypothetical protein
MKPIDPAIIRKLLDERTQQVEMLSRVGEALYGDRWQTQLAKALGISGRQMRRWASMEMDIPWSFLGEILPGLFQAKAQNLVQVLDDLIAWRESQLAAVTLPIKKTEVAPAEQGQDDG